jgi:hypothetical protein
MTNLEKYNSILESVIGNVVSDELGKDLMTALVTENFDDVYFNIMFDFYNDEFAADEKIEAVVEMVDVSSILEDKIFQVELKKAKKYMAHCQKNELKETTQKVTVGHDEYTFNEVSISTINKNRRAKKLQYCEALVRVENFAINGIEKSEFERLISIGDDFKEYTNDYHTFQILSNFINIYKIS